MLYDLAANNLKKKDLISDLVEPIRNRNPAVTEPDKSFSYIDLSSIDQERKIIRVLRSILGRNAPSRARQQVKAGDVLVSTVRPSLNGVALLANEHDGAVASTGFCVLRPDQRRLDPSYLFHWVKTPSFVDEMVRHATGATYPAVSDRIVTASRIPMVSLPEQRRIGVLLDGADALRAKRRAALAQLDEMAQAIFVDMFGDLKENDRKWPVCECKAVCTRIKVGVVVKPASYYRTEGVPAVRGTNIKPYGIDLSDVVYFSKDDSDGVLSKSLLKSGDLVVIRTGQPGLCAIVPQDLDGANAIDIIIATPNRKIINSVYMRELLNSTSGRQMILDGSKGQIQQHFNVGSLASARLIIPPLCEQNIFADRVAAVAKMQEAARSSLVSMNTLFASLQHRAFTGAL